MSEVAIKEKKTPARASAARPASAQPRRQYAPHVDVVETAEEWIIAADMPGADPKSLDVQFENGVLTLAASVPERDEQAARLRFQEYRRGDFKRTFRIDERIDASRAVAEFRHGVLKLTLPKQEAVKPRKIEVKVN